MFGSIGAKLIILVGSTVALAGTGLGVVTFTSKKSKFMDPKFIGEKVLIFKDGKRVCQFITENNRNDPFEECSSNWSLKNKETKNSFQIRMREEEVKRLSAENEQPEEWIVIFANDAKPRDAEILTKKEENEGYKWIEIKCEIEEISPQITEK